VNNSTLYPTPNPYYYNSYDPSKSPYSYPNGYCTALSNQTNNCSQKHACQNNAFCCDFPWTTTPITPCMVVGCITITPFCLCVNGFHGDYCQFNASTEGEDSWSSLNDTSKNNYSGGSTIPNGPAQQVSSSSSTRKFAFDIMVLWASVVSSSFLILYH